MDQPLLPKTEQGTSVLAWRSFVEELRKLSCLAGPLVAVSIAQYLLQVVSLMMIGHLSELSLSGVAIATSFSNVTGFSLLFGLAGALETLCGQAFGAEQYQKFGTYTCSGILYLLPICVPVSILWMFMDKLLIFIGQDPQISIVAREYSVGLIPALFGYAILQSLVRYFQSQSMILPMLLSSCVSLFCHVPVCWALVYKWELGNIGGAIAIGFSYWSNVVLLASYIWCSSSCGKTRIIYWKDVFSISSIKEFWRFALPSAVMVCLEWWTFEILTLLAGLLPDSKLETSVLSICLATTSLHYFVLYGIGAAASTRVANELGAGNPRSAQSVVWVALVIALTEVAIVSTTLFFCRNIFGYAFSNNKGVVDYVTEVAPLLCLSVIIDGLCAVLSGIARGCGWQHIGAFINLGAYYFVGIPVSVVLCFVLELRGKGLWIGVLVATTAQAALLVLITAMTNWQKQAAKARERIFEGTSSVNNELPST